MDYILKAHIISGFCCRQKKRIFINWINFLHASIVVGYYHNSLMWDIGSLLWYLGYDEIWVFFLSIPVPINNNDDEK